MRLLESVRHRPVQEALFDDNRIRRENQRDVAVFLQIVRNSHIMIAILAFLLGCSRVPCRDRPL